MEHKSYKLHGNSTLSDSDSLIKSSIITRFGFFFLLVFVYKMKDLHRDHIFPMTINYFEDA